MWRGRLLVKLSVLGGLVAGLACSGTGAQGDGVGHVPGPTPAGEAITASAAGNASPPSSTAPVSSSGMAAATSAGDQATPVAGTASESAQPAPKPVPKRSCTRDDQCGEHGFCDRGRCALIQSAPHFYGRPCRTNDQRECSNLPCIDGRCRSCVSDLECGWVRHMFSPKCVGDTFVPEARTCLGSIPSIPGGTAAPPPPRQ